jgi:exodeoxyribonuclease VII large subunit
MSDRGHPGLPFEDPEAGAEPGMEDGPVPGTRSHPFTVSEINGAARDLLEDSFPDVWLQAEISNFKAHGSGHLYFCLKDARAQINAVMWRSAAPQLRFKPADGLSVLARGRLTLYDVRGAYQMSVQWMEPLGLGSLQAAFEQLKARLKEEGLFDTARKRPIPPLPRRLGLVTSPTGAAVRDFLRVLERRHAGVQVLIAPCRVQGDTAAREIAAAIERLNRVSPLLDPPLDVIVLARGGGSLEDLWAFNEEIVARAIAASRLPVISAVGHEVDVTISDFVADLRAPTPSAAAEMVIRSREELLRQVASARSRLDRAVRYGLLQRRSRTQELSRRRAFAQVETRVRRERQRADEAIMRLGNAMLERVRSGRQRVGVAVERLSPRSLRAELRSRRQRLDAVAAHLPRAVRGRLLAARDALQRREAVLSSLSPLAVLDRGYALCLDPSTGRVICDSGVLEPGRGVQVRLARGGFDATVERVDRRDDG